MNEVVDKQVVDMAARFEAILIFPEDEKATKWTRGSVRKALTKQIGKYSLRHTIGKMEDVFLPCFK
jgi:hypothetical protein